MGSEPFSTNAAEFNNIIPPSDSLTLIRYFLIWLLGKKKKGSFFGHPWQSSGETPSSGTGGVGLTAGLGARTHASWPNNQNRKRKNKQYCSKFNKGFKKGPHLKKNL